MVIVPKSLQEKVAKRHRPSTYRSTLAINTTIGLWSRYSHFSTTHHCHHTNIMSVIHPVEEVVLSTLTYLPREIVLTGGIMLCPCHMCVEKCVAVRQLVKIGSTFKKVSPLPPKNLFFVTAFHYIKILSMRPIHVWGPYFASAALKLRGSLAIQVIIRTCLK